MIVENGDQLSFNPRSVTNHGATLADELDCDVSEFQSALRDESRSD